MSEVVLFKIKNGQNYTDLTQYVVRKGYDINRVRDLESWEDAFYFKHFDEKRKRVTGSFNLLFTSPTAYNDFVTLILGSVQSDATHKVIVYCQSTNSTLEVDALLTFKVQTAFKTETFGGDAAVFSVLVNLEER